MTTQILPPGPSPEAVERSAPDRSGDDGFASVLDRADRGRRDVGPHDRHDPDRRVRRSDRDADRERVERDDAPVDRERVERDDAPVDRARDERPDPIDDRRGDHVERDDEPASSSSGDVAAESTEQNADAAVSGDVAPSLDETATTEGGLTAAAESTEDAPADDDLLAVLGWVGANAPAEPTSTTGTATATPATGDDLPGEGVPAAQTGEASGVAAAVDIDLSVAAADAAAVDAAIVTGATTAVASTAAVTAEGAAAAEGTDPTLAPSIAAAGDTETEADAGADLTDDSSGDEPAPPPPPPPSRVVADAANSAQASAARQASNQNPATAAVDVALDPAAPDVTTEPSAPVQGAAVPAPSSTGPVAGPSPMLPSGAVQRIMEVVEEIARQTPPRSMTVDLSELEGVRVQVALDGAGVKIRVLDDMSGDARRQLERELARSLAERGFDLSHDGGAETRGGGDQRADRDGDYLPMSTGRVLRPTPASGPAPLSDQRGVRL